MSSAPFRSIPYLNNQGVDAMASGNFDEACTAFRYVLKAIRSSYIQSETKDSQLRSKLQFVLVVKDLESVSGELLFSYAVKFEDNAEHSIHDHGLLSAAVIFNLGLLHHIQGLQKCQQSILIKGTSLYQSCLKAFMTVAPSEESAGQAMIDILIMAALNNLAQISFEIMDYAESKVLCRRLEMFAQTVRKTSYGETQITEAVMKYQEVFLLNDVIQANEPVAAKAA